MWDGQMWNNISKTNFQWTKEHDFELKHCSKDYWFWTWATRSFLISWEKTRAWAKQNGCKRKTKQSALNSWRKWGRNIKNYQYSCTKHFMRWVNFIGKLLSGENKALKSRKTMPLQSRLRKSWRGNLLQSSPKKLLNERHDKRRSQKMQRNQAPQNFPPLQRKSNDSRRTTPKKTDCNVVPKKEWIFLHQTKEANFL